MSKRRTDDEVTRLLEDADPIQVNTDRRCRQLEVERLKRLVAELLLDKQMLQDVAKKSGDPPTSSEPPRTTWPSSTRSRGGGPAA
jgi:hypothetical protein